MKCQCGAIEYGPEWLFHPDGTPIAEGTPIYCGACLPPARYSVNETERYERFGATFAPPPQAEAYRYTGRPERADHW